jgi:putative ABC transport system permease protein
VGVLAKDEELPNFFQADVYSPLSYRSDPERPWSPNLFLLCRLKPKTSRESVIAALAAVNVDYPASIAPFYQSDRAALRKLADLDGAFKADIYWIICAAVFFLYAIATLNSANLMLVRMFRMRRELGIRLALGASRRDLVRLLSIESMVLTLIGTIGGGLVAQWLFPFLLRAAAGTNSGNIRFELGWHTLAVLSGLSLISAALIVVFPAIHALRMNINSVVKDGGASSGQGKAAVLLRNALVSIQIAFAVLLLAGAGLMIKTFREFGRLDLGFDEVNRTRILISFPEGIPMDPEARLARLRQVAEALKRVPGVLESGFSTEFLLSPDLQPTHTFARPDGGKIRAAMAMFGVGFEKVGGLRLKRGRWLGNDLNQILVNESLARQLWGEEDPIGKWVRPIEAAAQAPQTWPGWEVVGVVSDIRGGMRSPTPNLIFGPEMWGAFGMTSLVVQTSPVSRALDGLIRQRIYELDPTIGVLDIRSISELKENQLWAERLTESVLKVLATIAMVLATVGIFSSVAYTVSHRMAEFGVRAAVGAQPSDLAVLVVKQSLKTTGIGLISGVTAGLALSRFLESLLFNVSATDPLVWVLVSVLFIVATVLGSALPAWRAARVDVTKLLRAE